MNRYRWVVLTAGVGAQGAFAAAVQGLPALAPALRGMYGLTLPELGVVLASPSIGVALTVLAWGLLADRIGERTVIGLRLGGAAAALAAAALVPSLAALVAALVLAGMLSASAIAASGRAVAGWFGRHERGLALGVRHAALPLGAALAALTLPALAALGGVQASLLALAATSALAAFAGRYLRDAPREHQTARKHRLGPVLGDRRLVRLLAGGAVLTVVQWGTLGFLVASCTTSAASRFRSRPRCSRPSSSALP